MRVVIDTNIIVSGYLGGSLEAIIVAWKSGKFTLIVSRDGHLLELETFRDIPIVPAREFIERLRNV